MFLGGDELVEFVEFMELVELGVVGSIHPNTGATKLCFVRQSKL